MEITQLVRPFAAERGLTTKEALAAGMAEKRTAFTQGGGEIYRAP